MSPSSDEKFYSGAMRRMERISVFLAITGLVASWGARGWRAASGYAAGSVIAFVSFWILRSLVTGLSAADGGKPPASANAVALGLRYVVIGLALFAIIRFPGVEPALVFAGLLTTVAAALVEIAYELLFLRDFGS